MEQRLCMRGSDRGWVYVLRFGSSASATMDDEKSLGSEASIESTGFSLDDFSNVNKNNLRVRSGFRKKEVERSEVSSCGRVQAPVLGFARQAKAVGVRAYHEHNFSCRMISSWGYPLLTCPLNDRRQAMREEDSTLPDNISDLGADDIVHIEDLVPSRQLVKLSSHRQYAEIMRKQEMAIKKQKYLERLAAADEKEKGLLQSLAARRKAQRDHATKLCVMPSVVGLPKGLTLRDDPLKKASVFIVAMPELN